VNRVLKFEASEKKSMLTSQPNISFDYINNFKLGNRSFHTRCGKTEDIFKWWKI